MLSALTLDCALIVLVSLLGGMLPLSTVLNHTRLQAYLSFSAGTMLGAAFFHMLPEAVRMGTPLTIRWTALGLLALFFLERFFSFHHHEPPGHDEADQAAVQRSGIKRVADVDLVEVADECHHQGHHQHPHSGSSLTALSWGTAAFGLAVHSLVGGVALASRDHRRLRRAQGRRCHGLGGFPRDGHPQAG